MACACDVLQLKEKFGFILWWHATAPFYSQRPQPSNLMLPITPNMIINAAKSMVNLPQKRNTLSTGAGSHLLVHRLRFAVYCGTKLIHTKQCQQASIQNIFCGRYYSLLFTTLNSTALRDWATWGMVQAWVGQKLVKCDI